MTPNNPSPAAARPSGQMNYAIAPERMSALQPAQMTEAQQRAAAAAA